MKLFRAKLETKGYLHFYSSEYLKVTHVSDVLHNWALVFAINDVKSKTGVTDHRENLRGINFYCTPATPLTVDRRTYKRNPVPEDTGAGKMGLMEIEYYLPGSTFEFYILSRRGSPPPDLIHYGKKRTPCSVLPGAVDWDRASVPFRPHHEVAVHPVAHIVNPLDYENIDDVKYAKKIPMKPSPLYHLAAKFTTVLVSDRSKVVVPDIEKSEQWN